ncbi:hypothetical protein Tco_1126251, partial [Tanacetum coccineum]
MSATIGDGRSTSFWSETWNGDISFRVRFPRLFALELDHNINVADKMSGSVETSFRRAVRGGVEHQQLDELQSVLDSVILSSVSDRWYFSLSSSGGFSVKEVRLAIDNMVLPSHAEPT